MRHGFGFRKFERRSCNQPDSILGGAAQLQTIADLQKLQLVLTFVTALP